MAKFSNKNESFLETLKQTRNRGRLTESPHKSSSAPATLPEEVKKSLAVLHVFDWAEIVENQSNPETKSAPNWINFPIWDYSYQAPGSIVRYARSLSEKYREDWLALISSPQEALNIIQLYDTRPETETQLYFEALLRQTDDLDVDIMSPSQLKSLRLAGRWARRISPDLFSEEVIEDALPIANILSPFHHLISEQFVGREKFENQLKKFARSTPQRKRMWPFSILAKERLMMIEGIGGVGKTSLIGRFLINQWRDPTGKKLPFAYLACDDKTLDIRAINSFILAIEQDVQGIIAYNERDGQDNLNLKHSFQKLREDIESEQARLSKSGLESPSMHTTLESRISESRDIRDRTIQHLGEVIDKIAALFDTEEKFKSSFLLVIDSFEEAQYRTDEFQEPFWTFIQKLLESSHRLKIMISGRPPIKKSGFALKQKVQPLNDLSSENARLLLHMETGRPPEEFTKLVEQIGRNPLNLRLAARIIKDADNKNALDGINTKILPWVSVNPAIIRGQLYQRLLDHIKNEKVRKLAHPGMVLRRVTPDIIKHILADVCDLGDIGDEEAQELYTELSFEHTLVSFEADGSLKYRVDVREPVLNILKQDREKMVRKCHEAAIDYYANRPDVVSRAELIYHSLMLDRVPDRDDDLWSSDLAPRLTGSLSELPRKSKAWLASQTRMKISQKDLKSIDLEEQEKVVGREALTALNTLGPEAALKELRKLKARSSDSALYAIEIRSLMSLNKTEKALKKLDHIIKAYPTWGNQGRLIELLWLRAQCLIRLDNQAEALASFDSLIVRATETEQAIPIIQALSGKLSILKDQTERTKASQRLKTELEHLNSEDIEANLGIVRYAFGKLDRSHALGLVEIGRIVLGQLPDIILQSNRWQLDPAYFNIILKRAEDTVIKSRENQALTDQITSITADNKIAKSEVLSTLNFIQHAITTEEKPADNITMDPDQAETALGMTSVWALTNMELGDFSSATLSGLDDYRDDWEQEDSFSNSYLA